MNDKAKKIVNEDELVKDIVCGMTKPKSQMKAKTVYQGKTYYFCWDRDKQMFEAHPEYWVPKKEGDGKNE